MEAVRDIARTMQGRWWALRSLIQRTEPYADDVQNPKQPSTTRMGYEVQSSWYGLSATVEADNSHLRSASVVSIMVNGLVLLLIGFDASAKDDWNAIILGIYLVGVITAVAARGRSSQWTMTEFQVVDLASKILPPAICRRLPKRKDLKYLDDEDDLPLVIGTENSMERG